MSEIAQPDERHLSTESLSGAFDLGSPWSIRLKVSLRSRYSLTPTTRKLVYEFPCSTTIYRMTLAARMCASCRARPEGRFLEIVIDDPSLFIGAYPVLRAVADHIQLDGIDVMSALSSTIRLLDQLLRRDVGLSVEREIGLLGELLVLYKLCTRLAIADAIATWRSSESEEHDFSIYGMDVEVKTTSAERRTHWISSLTATRPDWSTSSLADISPSHQSWGGKRPKLARTDHWYPGDCR